MNHICKAAITIISVAVAIAIAIAIAIVTVILTNYSISNKIMTYPDIVGFLDKWQTLITGILAVIAAFITVNKMKKNHDDLIERKRLSLKALSNYAVGSLCAYCGDYFKYINNADIEKQPTEDEKYIKIIAEYIGYADKNISKDLEVLVQEYQVFNSRLSNFNDNLAHNKKRDAIITIAKLYAHLVHFFDHLRNKEQAPFIDFKATNINMNSALKSLTKNNKDFFSIQEKYKKLIEEEYPEEK